MTRDVRFGGHILTTQRKYKERLTDGGKICTKCNKEKPLDEYRGRSSHCVTCIKEWQKKQYKRKSQPLW
jgi:hypothetical protein